MRLLRPYPGWKHFRNFIIDSLELYRKIAEPKEIKRIDLRYINRFNSEKIEFDISNHFHIQPSIPIDRPIKNFFMRNELLYDELDSTLVLTLGSQKESQIDKDYIILDLNFFSLNQNFISFDASIGWIEKAHSYIEGAFQSCVSERMISLLRGD